jgi:hypothetical protein
MSKLAHNNDDTMAVIDRRRAIADGNEDLVREAELEATIHGLRCQVLEMQAALGCCAALMELDAIEARDGTLPVAHVHDYGRDRLKGAAGDR